MDRCVVSHLFVDDNVRFAHFCDTTEAISLASPTHSLPHHLRLHHINRILD